MTTSIMSQTQSPDVITNILSMRGSETRRQSLSIISRPSSRQLDDCGLIDLVQTWQKVKDRRSLDFCWRDGVEYQIVKLDHARGQAVLCPEQIKVLRRIERANGRLWAWRPGFAKFTIEATTLMPYGPQLEDLLSIERNFLRRRKYLRSLLNHDQMPLTLSILPDLEPGKPHPNDIKKMQAEQPVQKYIIPQRSLSVHIRSASQDNIRRGSSSAPASPTSRFPQLARPRLRSIATAENLSTLSQIQATIQPEPLDLEPSTRGLQVTFGCHDLREARYLHDQLCVLSPIMLAFTASTPVFRGRLSEFDVRLRHCSRSASDAKPGERCSLARPWRSLYPTYLGHDAPKSRLTRSTTNKDIFQLLRTEGFDDALAMFIAQGFTCAVPQLTRSSPTESEADMITPPLSGLELFQQLTTSLNPHVHLELPWPNDPRVGYRVTFTAMEVQLTDFSNAACIFFVALLRFAILGFDLDFRLPPHMVAENVAKAHKQNSILVEKFWWRSVKWRVSGTFGFGGGFGNNGLNDQPLITDVDPTLMSLDHIINGDPARPETVGLSGVLDAYLADVEDSNGSVMGDGRGGGSGMSEGDMLTISKYLAFIRRRAKGTVWTDARLIRTFVTDHPEFKAEVETQESERDDVKEEKENCTGIPGGGLTEGVWYDLIKRVEELNDGLW